MNTTIIPLRQIINNFVIRKSIFGYVKEIHQQIIRLKNQKSRCYKWVDIYSSFNLLVQFGCLNELKYRLENEGIDDHLYQLYNRDNDDHQIQNNKNNRDNNENEKDNEKEEEEEIDHRIIGLGVIACKYGHLNIIEYLNQHSQSRYIFNINDMTEAIQNGHLEVAEYLFDNRTEGFNSTAITSAARNGYNQLLERMLERWNNLGIITLPFYDVDRLDTLKIIYKYKHDIGDHVTTLAIKRRDLEMVKFINDYYPKRIPNDPFVLQFTNTTSSLSMSYYASRNQHVEIPEYLISLGGHFHTFGGVEEACIKGNLDVIKFHHERRTGTKWSIDTAAEHGHLDIVKYLHYNIPNVYCSSNAIDLAAKNGHLPVIQFLLENRTEGCTDIAMSHAISNDHLEVAEFLTNNRAIVINYYSITNQILKYLVDYYIDEIGNDAVDKLCEYRLQTVKLDIERVHLICRIIKEKGIKPNKNRWSNLSSLEGLKYLRLFTRETVLPDVLFDLACNNGNLGFVDFLLSKYPVRLSTKHLGISSGHSNIVPHLYDRWNPSPKKLQEAINTSKNSNPFIYNYLISKQLLLLPLLQQQQQQQQQQPPLYSHINICVPGMRM